MKLGVSLPDDLVAFADREAEQAGMTRSGFLAQLLEAERVRRRVSQYIDQHGWDVCEDDAAWQSYQKRRFGDDYGSDEW